MVFYEAPHKLLATLEDMYAAFGDRKIALVRELTKMHETIERTTLAAACEKYKETPPKGEFVLVVSGAEPLPDAKWTLDEAVAFAKKQVEKGVSKNEAAKIAAKESGIKKSDIYKALTQ